MKVLREGFTYEAENFENKDQLGQIVRFVEKERFGDESTLIQDGTTIEELIDIIIDRIEFMSANHQSPENFFVIHYLKNARMWMNERQREKNKRLRIKGKK